VFQYENVSSGAILTVPVPDGVTVEVYDQGIVDPENWTTS
jgi:hypothetical protein